jgi:hypothetical protein
VNTSITPELVTEVTQILETWANKRGLASPGRQLLFTVSIREVAVAPVVLEMMKMGFTPEHLDKLLCQPIQTLKLTNRAQHCMDDARILILGDLTSKTQSTVLKIRNLGKKSCEEIEEKLGMMDLTLDISYPIGPCERQILLARSIDFYVPPDAVPLLVREGIESVADLISRLTEVPLILEGSELKFSSYVYESIRRDLSERGLI